MAPSGLPSSPVPQLVMVSSRNEIGVRSADPFDKSAIFCGIMQLGRHFRPYVLLANDEKLIGIDYCQDPQEMLQKSLNRVRATQGDTTHWL